ncbi:MAG: catalase [Candidatus Azotimanducaceae bacterium]|jgi:catalase
MDNIPNNPFEENPIQREESAQIDNIADTTVKLLNKRYPAPQRILRGVHPKSHGCVDAYFEVNNDLSEALQVGVFAEPGKQYRATIRLSNAAVRVAHDVEDGKNGSRGMAIKVYDVEGDMLTDDNGSNNQDFLMVNSSSFAFANVEDYQRLTRTLDDNNDDASQFFSPLQVDVPEVSLEQKARIAVTAQLIGQIQGAVVNNPLEIRYFSAAPFLFGPDRMMKFSVEPKYGELPQAPLSEAMDDYLRHAMADTLNEGVDIQFDFKIQVASVGDGLDVENASTVWSEDDVPFVSVATLTIPAQQVDRGSRGAINDCEKLVFTPWHSLAAHQPIGGINRLRKKVYEVSAKHRKTIES